MPPPDLSPLPHLSGCRLVRYVSGMRGEQYRGRMVAYPDRNCSVLMVTRRAWDTRLMSLNVPMVAERTMTRYLNSACRVRCSKDRRTRYAHLVTLRSATALTSYPPMTDTK